MDRARDSMAVPRAPTLRPAPVMRRPRRLAAHGAPIRAIVFGEVWPLVARMRLSGTLGRTDQAQAFRRLRPRLARKPPCVPAGTRQPALVPNQAEVGPFIVSDYEWLVQLAAKGLRERDNHPMQSVTTPEAFDEVMAGAALDSIDLRALLERLARAERELETLREGLRQADIEAENAATSEA